MKRKQPRNIQQDCAKVVCTFYRGSFHFHSQKNWWNKNYTQAKTLKQYYHFLVSVCLTAQFPSEEFISCAHYVQVNKWWMGYKNSPGSLMSCTSCREGRKASNPGLRSLYSLFKKNNKKKTVYFSLFLHVNDGCGIISIRWSSDLMTDELQKHNSGKNGSYWQKKQKNHSRIGASRFASLTGRDGAPVLLDVIQFSLSLSRSVSSLSSAVTIK